MPSFPRRRESWLDLNNRLFLQSFMNIKQDSRLRGNDGCDYFLFYFRFCKGFSLKIQMPILRPKFYPKNTAAHFVLVTHFVCFRLPRPSRKPHHATNLFHLRPAFFASQHRQILPAIPPAYECGRDERGADCLLECDGSTGRYCL